MCQLGKRGSHRIDNEDQEDSEGRNIEIKRDKRNFLKRRKGEGEIDGNNEREREREREERKKHSGLLRT